MATTPTLSSPGIGSGLDVNGIVQKLMSVEQQPLTQLDKQESVDNARITAYGTLKGSLSALQTALQGLSSADSFNILTASTSDASSIGATITGKATQGSYSVDVTQLAQAHKLVSTGFANTTDAIGTGTLSFDFGTFDGVGGTFTSNGSGVKTVSIAAGQDSLAGIRDAVNAANIGVTATIVNDGSATGNRLVFTSVNSGAANSLKITVADTDGNNGDAAGLSQFAYDPAGGAGTGRNLTQKVAAQNALLTIDGIDVQSASNTIKGAVDGITLNLLKTTGGTPATLTVATNTSGVDSKLAAFVKAYNDLNTTFTTLTKYDSDKKQASVLTGDSTVRIVQNQLRSMLGGRLGSGLYSTLSQVGVTFQADGTLNFDSTKLDSAMASSPAEVTKLFAALGSASDPLTSVTGYTAKTVPASYGLNVTRLATQASLSGIAAANLTITKGVNDTLAMTVDGTTDTITLTPGTYADATAFAAEVEAKINASTAFAQAGANVKVSQAAGVITIQSNRYGSASSVAASGNGAADLFGGAPSQAAGADIAGTLGGQPMTGAGQTLLGPLGTSVEGLRVTVTGGATGARGNVDFETGFAYRLSNLVQGLIDTAGPIAARTNGLQSEITDIGKRRDALNTHLALVEANYRTQFNALDTLLSSLQAQSTQLQQQLAALPKIGSSSSSSG